MRTIVTLCGLTRFHDQYIEYNMLETLKGNIVLSCGVFGHDIHHDLEIDEELKQELDQLHIDKIAMSDEILVLNIGGYIGESTKREIEYAKWARKIVRFVEGNYIFAPCPECRESNEMKLMPTTRPEYDTADWVYVNICKCGTRYRTILNDDIGGTRIEVIK